MDGDDGDPFSFLGMHEDSGCLLVRVFLPQASRVAVLRARDGECVGVLQHLDKAGLFAGIVEGRERYDYQLRATIGGDDVTLVDPF